MTIKHFKFADFELDGAKRLLLKQGKPVALNSKTFDLLLALVENHGEVLSKDELLEKVWAGQFVEEGNLTVQVSILRKIFGETKNEHRFIVTVPGRGYSFVAELTDESNGEIVIENLSRSRIVVEEEIEEEKGRWGDGENKTVPKQISPSPFFTFSLSKIIVFGLILAAIAVGGYLWQRGRNSKPPVPFQQISIKRLTNIGNVTHARLSPDGKLYAYITIEGVQRTLWLGHVDGGEPRQLRPPTDIRYLSLKFSPDGSSLYYTTSAADSGSLYKLPVFGGVPEKIRENVRSSFTFAPDGRQFAFVRLDRKSSASALYIADTEGATERELAKPPTRLGFVWHNPSWSPDGARIAVGAPSDEKGTSYEIYLANVADGSVKPLTAHRWGDVEGTIWQTDGSGLIVAATEKDSILPQLWHVSFPDGAVTQILTDLNIYTAAVSLSSDDKTLLTLQGQKHSNIWVAPSGDLAQAKQITFGSLGRNDGWNGLDWIPDGRIIYTATTDKSITIWTMDADGKNQKQLIPDGGINASPNVTGDGRYVIFQSNRGGHLAIWRANIDGSKMVQLTGDGVAAQPHVSPDGKWVVYVSNAEEAGALWRVSIDGGEPLRLTEKRASWLGISPDSKLVACGYFADGKKKLAIIPIDGGEPLKLFDVPRLAEFSNGIRWIPDGKAITYRDWANGIWKQSLDGGEPERLEGLPQEKFYAYGWSRDGSQFAFTRGSEIRDIVLISSRK